VTLAKVSIRRSHHRERNVLVATGDFSRIFEAWREHVHRWELPVDGLGEVMMHQGLAGAALQLAFRVPEESTAWTLNLSRPAANLFVTGGGIHQNLTGRYFSEGVQETGFNRLFVQRAHPQKELQRSVLRVRGIDVLDIFEQFFHDSEQTAARLLELDPTTYAMVLALPGADPDWIAGLDPAALRDLDAQATGLDVREFEFHCGCDPDRVAGTLARMFADQADEFFRGEPVVEALCPRCGARHLLDRKTFDLLVDGL
jgi:molecular chaperone Hsp33